MPIAQLVVEAESTPNNWLLGAGSTKVAAVRGPDNDGTSYIASGASNNTQQQFTLGPPAGVQVLDLITSVQLRSRCIRGGSQSVNFVMVAVLGANVLTSTTKLAAGAYATFTENFLTRPGGGSWTFDDLGALQIRIQNTQARDLRCSTLEALVDYTEATQYPLTGPQEEILTSWLFEVQGYLDTAVNDAGVSARQALAANASLDVYTWIATGTKGPTSAQGDWDGCGMIWWMRAHDGVQVLPANRPPETSAWVPVLQDWMTSIEEGLANVSEAIRNQGSQPMTDEAGNVTSMGAGSHLRQQQLMIEKVLSVLT